MAITGFTFGQGTLNPTATTWNGTIPAGVAAGETLLVFVSENGSGQTYSISGGNVSGSWAVLSGPDANGTLDDTQVWIATASGTSAGATVTVTSSANGRFIGAGVSVPGFVVTGALVALTQQSASTTSMPFPSVTVPNASGWQLLGFASMRKTSAGAPSLTAPSGTSKIVETASNYGSSAEFTDAIVASTATVGSGSQTPGTGTSSAAAATSNLYTIALAPLAVNLSGSLAVTGSGSTSFGGSPQGSGSLAVSGSGSLSMSGVRGYVGSLAVSGAGSLALSGAPRAAGTLAVTGSGALTLFSGSGQGALTVTGTGTTTFARTIGTKGTLAATGVGALLFVGKLIAAGALTITGSGALVFTGRAIVRHSWWDGTAWRSLSPQVWGGQSLGWLTIPVAISAVGSFA